MPNILQPHPVRRAAEISLALGLLALLLLRPQQSVEGIEAGLRCCAGQIIPALFPFFVVTNLIAGGPAAKPLSRVLYPAARALGMRDRQAATALLLGWLGGFAVAANCVAQLYAGKKLTKEQAELLLVSAVGSGPAFVVNSVGLLMLGSHRAGVLLMVSLLAANFVCGLLFRFFGRLLGRPFLPQKNTAPQAWAEEDADKISLVDAVRRAVDSTLTVCGFVLFFRFLCVVLGSFSAQGTLAAFWLNALLEVTSGCLAGAALGTAGIYACCAALSLQSLSVFLQVRALLPKELSLRPLLLCRPLHLVLSLLFLRLGVRIFPAQTPAFSSLAPRLIPQTRMALDTALLLFFLCCTVLRNLTPQAPNIKKAASLQQAKTRP